MGKLNSQSSLERFFHSLAQSDKRILFLDYDGTLAEFKTERDKALPYPGVIERLKILTNSASTRLIIISGRSLDDLKKLINLKNYPDLIGGHGAEIFNPLSKEIELKIDEKAREGLLAAQKWAIETQLYDCCERKLSGLAFHWRGRPENIVVEMKKKIRNKWITTADEHNLELHDFDGGIELRYANVNKGIAVESILNEKNNGAIVAYLGDDHTDEEAFERLGNKALKILVRKEPRQTKADLQIEPPEELIEFLDRWIELDR